MSETAFEKSVKNQTSSAGRLFGRSVIYGKEDEACTPYMTRYWIGRLRLHIFHRGDQDEDCHDHPWPFWTFPFTSYVEEVVEHDPDAQNEFMNGLSFEQWQDWIEGKSVHRFYRKRRQVVPAWRPSYRRAEHCHRVLGRHQWTAYGPEDLVRKGRIVTLVWRGKERRKWGFLKHRDGRWCWQHWKEYVLGGGKDAPCSDD